MIVIYAQSHYLTSDYLFVYQGLCKDTLTVIGCIDVVNKHPLTVIEVFAKLLKNLKIVKCFVSGLHSYRCHCFQFHGVDSIYRYVSSLQKVPNALYNRPFTLALIRTIMADWSK